MGHRALRTLLMLSIFLILSVHRLQLSRDGSAAMPFLLATWGFILLLGAVGIALSARRDGFDLMAFAALVIIALLFVGIYLKDSHLRRESIEAINAALALAEDSSPCSGSDIWLTFSVPVASNEDVGKFEGFLEEFNLSPHLQERDEMEDAVYGTICAMGSTSDLKKMEERASELGWSYHVTNLTALWKETHGGGIATTERGLRVDFFVGTPRWHTERYFRHLSRELAGMGILVSILGLLLRLPRGE